MTPGARSAAGAPSLRLSALLLVAACGGEPPTEAVSTIDSAGVEVVTNHRDPGSLPTWTVAAQPRLDLGVMEGDEAQQFFRVMDALRLDDGRLVVVNAGTQQLRLFEPSGELVETLGGEGEGPGEYRFPFRAFQLPGDSLLVYDLALARFTVLGPGRSVVRTFRPERALMNEPQLAGLIGDSLIVSHETIYDIPSSGFDTMQSRVAFFDMDGRGRDSMMVPTARMGMLTERGLVGSPHFEPRTAFAAGGEGLWLGTGRTPELRLYGPALELRRVVRWTADVRPVSDNAVGRLIEHHVARAGAGQEQRNRSIYEGAPAAETMPVYDELLLDSDGRVWLRSYQPPYQTGPAEWLVLTAEGELLARAELPGRLRVHDVGRDYVLGTLQDEVDVEHVVLWDLARGS